MGNLFRSFSKVPVTEVGVQTGGRGNMFVIQNIQQNSLICYRVFERGNGIEAIGREVLARSSDGDEIILDPAGKADRKILSSLSQGQGGRQTFF